MALEHVACPVKKPGGCGESVFLAPPLTITNRVVEGIVIGDLVRPRDVDEVAVAVREESQEAQGAQPVRLEPLDGAVHGQGAGA